MKENLIVFPSEVRLRDVRAVESQISHLVEFRGYLAIELDFSRCMVIFAECMVPLVCFCLSHAEESIKFTIKLPMYDKLRRLFINCGWANLLAPRQFKECGIEISDNIPVIRFIDHTKQDAIVNQCVDRLLKQIEHLKREDLRAVEWTVNEICDNVMNHSKSRIGGLFQLNICRIAREVEFMVADAGIGIPDSLRSIKNHEWTDEIALEQCIKQGVTRDPNFGQGNGLYGSFEMAAISGGAFHINSGHAHLVLTRGGHVQVKHDKQRFSGTLVLCAINFSQNAILEQALAFKGENYHMVDLVELKYEIDENTLLFSMRSEADSLGSRRSGFEIRRKMSNLLIMNGHMRILCDMDGIGVMSSSFADEVFGKLAREFGPSTYRERVALTNLSVINEKIIAKAIEQRLAVSF